MKSEERHEIEKNELEKLFDKGSEKLGPYASYIIYGLLAVAAVWAIVRLSANSMASRHAEAWDAYTTATLPGRFDAAALETAAQEHAGEPMGELAELAYADSQLAEGCRVFFANKKQAMDALDAAQEKYEQVAGEVSDEALRGRAELGIAKALEAKGEIKQAIAAYEEVTGPFSEMADRRAELLGEVGAVDYASWLARAEGASRNFDPTSFGSRPDFSADSLSLPGADGGTADAAGDGEGGDFFDLLDQYQQLAPEQPQDEQPTGSDMPGGAGDDIVTPQQPAGDSATGGDPSAGEPATDETSGDQAGTEQPADQQPAADDASSDSEDKPAGEGEGQ